MHGSLATALRRRRLALALVLAVAGPGLAAAQSAPMAVPGPADQAPAVPSAAPAVPVDPGTPSELYLALFFGSASFSDTTVTAHRDLILSPTITVNEQASFEAHSSGSLRFGFWGGSRARYLGLAMDLGNLDASQAGSSTSGASIHGATLYLEPLLRLPLFATAWAPDGVLNVYAGLALGGLLWGDVSVTSPQLPVAVTGPARGFGIGLVGGFSIRLWNVVLLAEARATRLDLDFEQFFEGGHVELDSRQLLVGAGWRF
jgi:hypothetical protein